MLKYLTLFLSFLVISSRVSQSLFISLYKITILSQLHAKIKKKIQKKLQNTENTKKKLNPFLLWIKNHTLILANSQSLLSPQKMTSLFLYRRTKQKLDNENYPCNSMNKKSLYLHLNTKFLILIHQKLSNNKA